MSNKTTRSDSAKAAIEAGTQAMYGFQPLPEIKCDEAGGVTVSSNNPWEWMTAEQQEAKRGEVELAYRAMAPLIRAQELRDFAAHIDNLSKTVGFKNFNVERVVTHEARIRAEVLEAGGSV